MIFGCFLMNDRLKFIKFCKSKFKGEYSLPHSFKVEQVLLDNLSKYPRVESLRLACLGHDLLEDTDTTVDELKEYLSEDIIDIILRVTDKEGKNRKERHLNTYFLIREKEEAVIVKLCDRIANMNENLFPRNKMHNMYFKKEKDYFKFALYDPRHVYAKKLWKEYDILTYRYRKEN